jgi:hypothetical protein
MVLRWPPPNRVAPTISNTNLCGFIERFVDKCYCRNVAKIVPLLKVEYIAADCCLRALEHEFEAVSLNRLKDGADSFCNNFCKGLKDSI